MRAALLALALPSTALAQSAVLGVPRAQWGSYAAGADGQFQCKDGMSSIPMSKLNDEYCDCADGSDEPGTSACAGAAQRFYCENLGFRPAYVRASVVNDGICDCCDASDEHASGAGCQNTCVEDGKQARVEAEQRVGVVANGVATASQWAEEAAKAKGGWEAEIATLKASLAEKKAAADAIAVEKEAAEKVEAVRREEFLATKRAEEEAKKAAEEAEKAAEQKRRLDLMAAAASSGAACVAWRQTGDCDPAGPRQAEMDLLCNETVQIGFSGYCECGGARKACELGAAPSRCSRAMRCAPAR